jgi:hypothetical protein
MYSHTSTNYENCYREYYDQLYYIKIRLTHHIGMLPAAQLLIHMKFL